jgi:hypothetical protein
VPPNLSFLVDDLEEPWAFSSKFDFIFARMLTGSLANWPRFLEQGFEYGFLATLPHEHSLTRSILRNLNPGGWIELADISFPLESDDDTLPADSALKRWNDLSLEASYALGRPLNSAEFYAEQMAAAGFRNIVAYKHKWPQNSWPKDRKYKEMGTSYITGQCLPANALNANFANKHTTRNVVSREHVWRHLRLKSRPIYSWTQMVLRRVGVIPH